MPENLYLTHRKSVKMTRTRGAAFVGTFSVPKNGFCSGNGPTLTLSCIWARKQSSPNAIFCPKKPAEEAELEGGRRPAKRQGGPTSEQGVPLGRLVVDQGRELEEVVVRLKPSLKK